MFFRKRRDGAAAVAERAGDQAAELFAQIDEVVEANRAERDPERERQILRLRHQAGALLVAAAGSPPSHPEPLAPPSSNGSGLVEVSPAELSPQLLRGAMLSSGCLVVRGLVGREEATGMVSEMERSFAAREQVGEQGTDERA